MIFYAEDLLLPGAGMVEEVMSVLCGGQYWISGVVMFVHSWRFFGWYAGGNVFCLEWRSWLSVTKGSISLSSVNEVYSRDSSFVIVFVAANRFSNAYSGAL